MSRNPDTRFALCGNCKHFVAGGQCELVQGQIKTKDTCDLFEKGQPQSMSTKVNPKYKKSDVNYRSEFMTETVSGDIAQGVISMEHELLSRGIPEEEVHRAVVAYFSQPEPPNAMPWPGPVTGLDLAGRIDPLLVFDSGVPLTDFNGLPDNVEPYPTPNISPYGIGDSYPSNPTPDPNSFGNKSNTYDIQNYRAPESMVWNGLASDVSSEPSMEGEHGYNVATTIPTFPDNYEALHSDSKIRSRIIEPSGAISELKKDDTTKKKLVDRIGKWTVLLGGVAGMDAIIKNYLDSETDEPLEIIAEYNYHGHDSDDECAKFSGKRFNLLETHNRPVIPSEKLGYTTTHPQCVCTWDVKANVKPFTNKLSKKEQDKIDGIETHITDAAKKGKLHKIDENGNLSKKTTKKNPLKELCSCMNVVIPSVSFDLSIKNPGNTLQESIFNLRDEFGWLTDNYVNGAKNLTQDTQGVLYLIRAAGESITDHRAEGETYRRKLTAEELNSMTRTIIGKSMDLNHQPEFEIDATILDAEFDKNRKEIQTLVIVNDPQINQAIDDGTIAAVSINGGMPRSESVERCNHDCNGNNCELCLVPRGVVLGELDGIGMTFVVTDPNGLYWNGHFVSSAEPGIKITRIQKL